MKPVSKQRLSKHFRGSSDISNHRDGIFREVCIMLTREVNSDAKSVQGSYEWVAAALARDQVSWRSTAVTGRSTAVSGRLKSELELGLQKSTRGEPVKI
jgi:hypothetical protein